MTPDQKLAQLIVRLNKLTAQGEISWTVENPPRALVYGTNDVIPLFLSSRYKEQSLGLYSRRYRLYDGERDEFHWNETIVLAFLDIEGRVVWDAQDATPALWDLFETAKRKAANVEGLINSLLSDSAGD